MKSHRHKNWFLHQYQARMRLQSKRSYDVRDPMVHRVNRYVQSHKPKALLQRHSISLSLVSLLREACSTDTAVWLLEYATGATSVQMCPYTPQISVSAIQRAYTQQQMQLPNTVSPKLLTHRALRIANRSTVPYFKMKSCLYR